MVSFVGPDGGNRVVCFPPQDAELIGIQLLGAQPTLLHAKTGLIRKDIAT